MNDDKKESNQSYKNNNNIPTKNQTKTNESQKRQRDKKRHKNGKEKANEKKSRAELQQKYLKRFLYGRRQSVSRFGKKKKYCVVFFLSSNVSIHKFTLYKHTVNVSECIQRQANTNRMRANGFIVWSRITYHRQRYLLYTIHNRKREK